MLCYSFVFVFISGHALCLTLCFSPTFLLSVTGCSVWSAIAAEILKKLQCRNLLNGKPQCGQKNPHKDYNYLDQLAGKYPIQTL